MEFSRAGHLRTIAALMKYEVDYNFMMTSFKITDHKVIKLAECVEVPKVMIIYGKNSTGKSTFLDGLRQMLTKEFVEKGGTVINIEPKDRSILASYFDNHNQPATITKAALVRLEILRATSSLIEDNKNSVRNSIVSYVYEPLDNLLNIVLPYLKFKRVELSASPTCIFAKSPDSSSGNAETEIELEIDSLARAETELIAQFLPLIEHQILRKLVSLVQHPTHSEFDNEDTVVLIDMPGLRLPPEIQDRLLDYFRFLTRNEQQGKIQFIVVTSSADIILKTSGEEPFLLVREPSSNQALSEVRNQLMKISDVDSFLADV